MTVDQNIFPTIQGENLERQRFILPQDLQGVKNVLLVAFQQWHQTLVDSWAGPLGQLIVDRSDVYVYEIPVLPRINPLGRFFIDGAMRRAIPSRQVRETTITVYLDREQLIKQLDIPNFDTIVPMIVQPDGRILWRGQGGYEAKQFSELKEVLE